MGVPNIRSALLAAVLLLAGTAAHADVRNFRLYNQTRETIVAVGVSIANDPQWHAMQGPTIGPGDYEYFTFDTDDLNGVCNVQLKVKLANGDSPEWLDSFDLCHTSYIRIYYDPDSGAYEAGYQ